MPRIASRKMDYKKKDLCNFINGRMRMNGIMQEDMAERLGLSSQQSFSYKISHAAFRYEDLLRIFDILELTDDERLKLMKL
jgi:hypothetical protein